MVSHLRWGSQGCGGGAACFPAIQEAQSASALENISVAIYRPGTDARLAQKEPRAQYRGPLPSQPAKQPRSPGSWGTAHLQGLGPTAPGCGEGSEAKVLMNTRRPDPRHLYLTLSHLNPNVP